MFDFIKEIHRAEKQIRPYVRQTPLDFSLPLSKLTHTNTYLKCENLQYTGSFKVRGAFHTLLSLSQAQRQQGVITASSGNHGAAIAYGLNKLNIKGAIFVPENASSTKVDNIRNYNIPLKFYGTDLLQTEMHAFNYAKQQQMTYISPYNNPLVIAGQGTLGLELSQQLEKIDLILVPVGGGGLISGIAGFIKSLSPKTMVIGCLPANSPVMAKSINAGKIIEMETFPTLSDATAGGIEADSITFDFCKNWVDDYILVSEQEIKEAILLLISSQHLLVEGASGVALAALLKSAAQYTGKNIVVILSGANISLKALKNCLL